MSTAADEVRSRRRDSVTLDLATNRSARKYSAREQLMRVAWSVGQWAIKLSPRPLFGWRRAVLRAFGAKIGKNVHIYPSTRIYMPWNVEIGDWTGIGEDVLIYSLGKVRIGAQVTISYRSHLCAGSHDLDDPALPLTKPAIIIESQAWIGTDAFIGPGVIVGQGAIVGARAVAVKEVQAFHKVAGNPARQIGVRRSISS